MSSDRSGNRAEPSRRGVRSNARCSARCVAGVRERSSSGGGASAHGTRRRGEGSVGPLRAGQVSLEAPQGPIRSTPTEVSPRLKAAALRCGFRWCGRAGGSLSPDVTPTGSDGCEPIGLAWSARPSPPAPRAACSSQGEPEGGGSVGPPEPHGAVGWGTGRRRRHLWLFHVKHLRGVRRIGSISRERGSAGARRRPVLEGMPRGGSAGPAGTRHSGHRDVAVGPAVVSARARRPARGGATRPPVDGAGRADPR